MLYDFYGSLLSEAKSEVMALYHEDNLSLSEIAEQLGTSRQAVHYTLKKAEKALQTYEDRLGLIEAYRRSQRLASEAIDLIERSGLSAEDGKDKLVKLIRELSE
jgi:hypothetical protein